MPTSAPERDRWLALGLLVAALALGYLLLVHWWWTQPMLELEQRIGTLQQRDARARAELQQAPAVAAALQRLQQEMQGTPAFLAEPTMELATAGLVQRLEQAVEQASPGNRACRITTRSPLQQQLKERFPRAVVQVRLLCGMPELLQVLYSLEAGSPRLFIDDFEASSQRVYAGGDSPQGGGVDVGFNLFGFLRPAAGAVADDAP